MQDLFGLCHFEDDWVNLDNKTSKPTPGASIVGIFGQIRAIERAETTRYVNGRPESMIYHRLIFFVDCLHSYKILLFSDTTGALEVGDCIYALCYLNGDLQRPAQTGLYLSLSGYGFASINHEPGRETGNELLNQLKIHPKTLDSYRLFQENIYDARLDPRQTDIGLD